MMASGVSRSRTDILAAGGLCGSFVLSSDISPPSLSRRWAAAPLGNVPEVDELLASELTLVDQVLAEAAVDAPAPALAAARPAHIGLRHGEVVGRLFGIVQGEVVGGYELLRHT